MESAWTRAGFDPFNVGVLERERAFTLVRFAVRAGPSGGGCIEVADLASDARAYLRVDASDLATAGCEWRGACGQWSLRFDPVLAAAALRMRLVAAARASWSLALGSLSTGQRRLSARGRTPARVAFAAATAPAATASPEPLEVARLFFDEGRKLRSTGGSPDTAELLLYTALDTQHAELGDDQRCAVTRNELGLLMREAGRDAEALRYFGDAYAFFVDRRRHEHPDLATTLHNHGATLLRLGRRAEAESELRTALSLHERHRRSTMRDHANTLWLLAEAQDEAHEAEMRALLERSLALRELGGFGADLDASLIAAQLARACLAASDLQLAFHFAQRRLDILDGIVGPADARMRAAVQWASDLFAEGGRAADAERLRRRFPS